MDDDRYPVLKWIVRVGLLGEAGLFFLLTFPSLFVGGMAFFDNPSKFALIRLVDMLVILSPLVVGVVLILAANFVASRPRYNPYAMVLVCFVAAGSVYLGYSFYSHTKPRTVPPPLTEGLAMSIITDVAQSDRLTAFLQNRFPVGSPAASLVAELQREHFGFGRRYVGTSAGPYATYEWYDGPCYYSLRVAWISSPNNRIVSISGKTNRVICHDQRFGKR